MIKKNLKNISFNLGLVIGSIISAIFLIEIILINFGSYQHLVKTELTPSISVYERPSNSYQKQKHNFYARDTINNRACFFNQSCKRLLKSSTPPATLISPFPFQTLPFTSPRCRTKNCTP